MTPDLLDYYNRELAYFRRMSGEFAERHPKIAGRLRITPETSEDPHVERMIEAFALLAARIRLKIDDDLPEIGDALIDVLYPHLQRPIPSLSIARFDIDASQGEPPSGYEIPRGSELDTEPVDGEPIRFRTCYPVTLWPIEVADAQCAGRPLPCPTSPRSADAVAVVRLQLVSPADGVGFGSFPLESLRFYLKGLPGPVHELYEALFNDRLEIVLAASPSDPNPIVLPPDALRPVGFAEDEGLLPYATTSHTGYRLLTEYFTLPEKFLFVDLVGLDRVSLERFEDRLEVYVLLRRTSLDLERSVERDTFQLGCTPIVNLFRQRAEPVVLSEAVTENRVVPDSRRPLANEIHSIDEVTAITRDGDEVPCAPFYSVRHGSESTDALYWFASRRPAESTEGVVDEGTDLHLTLVDLALDSASRDGWYLDVETTCTNRDLPHRIPIGGAQPDLTLVDGSGIVTDIRLLVTPTRTRRPAQRRAATWRLVSHLSLGHLSLTDGDEGARALREILALYDFADSPETRSTIRGIESVTSERIVGRISGDRGGGIARGIEVRIALDERAFTDTGAYLFAAVLERFLGLYCSINTFTRLVVTIGERDGVFAEWPPRVGQRVLV